MNAPRILDYTSDADGYLVTQAREWSPVVSHEAEDYGAAVYPVNATDPGLGYVLWWNDYVVNEWAEFLPTLPLALVRFALLIDAVERDAFFDKSLDDFAADVEGLFNVYAVC